VGGNGGQVWVVAGIEDFVVSDPVGGYVVGCWRWARVWEVYGERWPRGRAPRQLGGVWIGMGGSGVGNKWGAGDNGIRIGVVFHWSMVGL